MKTALDLVGGGAKGIITAGAVKYIVEKGVHYDAVFATSSGSLNAVFLAMGDIDLLERMWLTISNRDVRKLTPWKLLTKDACVYDSTPLYKTILKYLDMAKIRANPIPHIITLTDYKLTEPFHVMLNNEHYPENVARYLLASCSIPLLFAPVSGRFYDGGVMDDYNVGHALDLWYQRQIVVHPSRPAPIDVKGFQGALDVLMTCMGWANYQHMKARFAKDNKDLIEVIPAQQISLPIMDFDYKSHDRKKLIQFGYDLARSTFEASRPPVFAEYQAPQRSR